MNARFLFAVLLCALSPASAALANPFQALTTATFRDGIFCDDYQYNWEFKAETPEERFNDVEIMLASRADIDLSTYSGPGQIAPVDPANPNMLRITNLFPGSADGLGSSLSFSMQSVCNPNTVEGFPAVTLTRDGNVIASGRSRAPTDGTLSVSAGQHIDGERLRDWINEFIPEESNRLLVFTQCFGGNMVRNFNGDANTAVASGTSPGETGKFGGYHDDAARALRPGGGIFRNNNGQDVHNAGNSGRHASENPITGGGLGLGDFDLQNTSATGDVQSRHVLHYAGQPDNRASLGNTTDNNMRTTINNNFAGQVNTTVTNVGGRGAEDGWDQPGTAAGLRQALSDIGTAIRNSPDPSKEQFILYVGDHGDQDVIIRPRPMPVAPAAQVAFNDFPTFTNNDLNPQILLDDPGNVAGFTTFVAFPAGITHPVGPSLYMPYFQPGDWSLTVDNGEGTSIVLTDFMENYLELGGGVIGDEEGEGVELYFPMDDALFTSEFFNVYMDMTLTNMTSGTPRAAIYNITEFNQDTGSVSRIVPEPSGIVLALAGVTYFALPRRGRAK